MISHTRLKPVKLGKIWFSFVTVCIAVFIFFQAPKASAGSLIVNVSVDWEGEELAKENIEAMLYLRQQHPDVPFIQFLNAAYYTKQNSNSQAINTVVKALLLDNDEHGMHVHSWKTLVEQSGVNYISSPSLLGDNESLCADDCGFSVPLELYSTSEIQKILRTSKDILRQNGFQTPTSFRAGAWMAGPKVRAALAAEEFSIDSSAVPWQHLNSAYSNYKLFRNLIADFWPGLTSLSQPFNVSTQFGNIVEMPDNGCLADYMPANAMVEVFNQNKKIWSQNKQKNIYVHIGLHLESASRFAKRVDDALRRIKDISENENLDVEFRTFQNTQF